MPNASSPVVVLNRRRQALNTLDQRMDVNPPEISSSEASSMKKFLPTGERILDFVMALVGNPMHAAGAAVVEQRVYEMQAIRAVKVKVTLDNSDAIQVPQTGCADNAMPIPTNDISHNELVLDAAGKCDSTAGHDIVQLNRRESEESIHSESGAIRVVHSQDSAGFDSADLPPLLQNSQ